ncbi:MAG: Teichoic acids export ATP-binding protein TagH [Candidatus Celerinatantimonas neptuna]|nr:MAG: Teichoic acids export ATP-binding protein TagH [Candidatus Celerinatantimonas neptuna]
MGKENISIEFNQVTKSYPLYHHISSGLKSLLLNPLKFYSFLKDKNYTAIEDISFYVNKGECLGLIGKNGAGKSTSLGLMAGVLRPSSGNVMVNGRVAAMLELGGGFHPDLTGLNNIYLNAILLGLTKKEVDEKINDIVSFSELEEFINEPIRIYSSGMLARLGFSIISQINPEILIIDEVLAVGDAKFQHKCLKVIESFKNNGVTVVIVSHNTDDIKKYCDKVAWFENHKLRAFGNCLDIIQQYELTI